MKRPAYSQSYLQAVNPRNAHWRALRYAKWKQVKGVCELCHRKISYEQFQLHHKHYRTLGSESLQDVMAVHRWPCHRMLDLSRKIATATRRIARHWR